MSIVTGGSSRPLPHSLTQVARCTTKMMMTGRNQTGETPPLPGNERPHWKPTRKILTKDEMTRENRKTVKERKKKRPKLTMAPPPRLSRPLCCTMPFHAVVLFVSCCCVCVRLLCLVRL